MKSARTKACDISPKVRQAVGDRDGWICILCERPGIPNGHYLPRSDGGLGIVENVVTLCPECHRLYDNGYDKDVNVREKMGAKIRVYLEEQYPGFPDEKRLYHKYDW
jgi:5-methylcytosine-specific restriction endonuclease McrA